MSSLKTKMQTNPLLNWFIQVIANWSEVSYKYFVKIHSPPSSYSNTNSVQSNIAYKIRSFFFHRRCRRSFFLNLDAVAAWNRCRKASEYIDSPYIYKKSVYILWVKNLYSEPDLCCNTKLNCQQRTWNFRLQCAKWRVKKTPFMKLFYKFQCMWSEEKRMDSSNGWRVNKRVQWRSKDKCIQFFPS